MTVVTRRTELLAPRNHGEQNGCRGLRAKRVFMNGESMIDRRLCSLFLSNTMMHHRRSVRVNFCFARRHQSNLIVALKTTVPHDKQPIGKMCCIRSTSQSLELFDQYGLIHAGDLSVFDYGQQTLFLLIMSRKVLITLRSKSRRTTMAADFSTRYTRVCV